MKKMIYPRFLVITFLLLVSCVWAWGQTTITFDISKGNVRLTDATYRGKDSEGNTVSGAHNSENKYIISGTTTSYNVQVGTADNMVTKNFIIYLNNVDIEKSSGCAFSVYNQELSVVAVILQNNSKNKLYSGGNRAGLEKSGGALANGTLLVTCEDGYVAWLSNSEHGHTTGKYSESACTESCGHLDARSGNAWDGTAAETYKAGAGIGTAGQGEQGSATKGANQGTNALVNLTIAGGNIEARGAWGYSSGTSGGGAAIGTGSAKGQDITGGTITGLNITGGNIKAYRIDNSAACVGGGYRSGYVTMNIYGGTIDATLKDPLSDNKNSSRTFDKMRAAAIGGGGGGRTSPSPAGATVHIHNGKITALGQYGSAIGSGAGGAGGYGQDAVVIIDNGNITATTNQGDGNGSGAAIGSGGSMGTGHAGNADITINGGVIVASSELGADIGGGGTNSTDSNGYGGTGIVKISGGTITANKGGIGGGRANAGVGGDSQITISGTDTHITANSIGGGRSVKQTGGNVTLNVSGGKLTVADFIGGGIGGADKNLIGWAKVSISGGDISGRTVMRASTSGGCEFKMTGGKLTSPIKDQPGGAVYMIDPKGVATMSGGTIYDCTGTTGGAIYMSGGTFTISGDAVMQNNQATDGGAVYLDGTGKLQVTGGTIQENTVSGNGGALYLKDGEFSMTGGKVMTNQSTNGNGAGVYIASGIVNISGGEVTANKATKGKGGGFYVNGGTVTLSNGTIVSNQAALAGGGICLEGSSIQVNGCTLTQNEATAGNGGGVFLSNGTMTYNGGKLTYNKASGTGTFTTAYHSETEGIQGVGGGIYISNGSSLTFGDLSNLGIYANSATMAADDLFADGNGTTLVVPNISEMRLQDYAGNAEGLGWYEDYFAGDTSYNGEDVAKADATKTTFNYRFKEAQELGSTEDLREYILNETTKKFQNIYVAFALGFKSSDLIIQVKGLVPGESCVFSVVGTAEGGKYNYQVPIHGTNAEIDQQRIVRLPVDKYTVKLLNVWPWAYDCVDPIGRTITRMNSLEEGIYKFIVGHKSTSIAHDEDYVKKQL